MLTPEEREIAAKRAEIWPKGRGTAVYVRIDGILFC
jgi:hypothetical protein